MASTGEVTSQTTEPVLENNTATMNQDPFASQREDGHITEENIDGIAGDKNMAMPGSESPPRDRRMSKEWDAAKVPPSQFQKRKGSLLSTPSSRDSHITGSDRDKAYFEKLKEKGWNVLKK